MKLCPNCQTKNEQHRATCTQCHYRFYTHLKQEKKYRRTQDEINQETLDKRKGGKNEKEISIKGV